MATNSAAAPVASSSTVHNQQPTLRGQFSIANILEAAASTQDDAAVAQLLRGGTVAKDVRESTYASLLADGRDPLDMLDPATSTLLYMYILSARLTVMNASPPPVDALQNFCENFNPEKARLAPERVTLLGKAMVSFFEASNTLANSIPLLSSLITRYPPSPSHLTTLHSIFASACVRTRDYATLLSVLSEPILEVDLSLSNLHYNDNLVYHYAKGFAAVGLRRFEDAEECFEAVVAAPAQAPAAIQLEALKKLALVQLIQYGKAKEVPKYVNLTLVGLYKKTPYSAFAREYPTKQTVLEDIIEKAGEVFASDKNMGLVRLALERARRWAIRRLTETYISISLAEIGNTVGLVDDVEAVRTIVQSMIYEHEISASISADDTVTFTSTSLGSDFVPSDINSLLQAVQTQNTLLSALNKQMELDKGFVRRALKSDGNGAGPGGHGLGDGLGATVMAIEMGMGDDAMGLDEDSAMKGQFESTWAEED